MNDDVKITNCPKCSSNDITFDISSGKLKCNYCGEYIEIEKNQNNNINELNEQVVHKGVKTLKDDKVDIVALKCSSCGNKLISGRTDNYPKCHWCGGSLSICEEEINNEQVSILPFIVSRKEAIEIIKNNIKKKKYARKGFIEDINPESLVCVYFPYQMIDADYKCNFSGIGERKVDYFSSDDSATTYLVNSYNVERSFILNAKNICFESKMDSINNIQDVISNIISSANPFDVSESVPLDGKYLKNITADVVDRKEVSLDERMYVKLTNVAKYAILDEDAYYDRGICWEKTYIELNKLEPHYVYLPIWLIQKNEIVNEKKEYYYVAVNGRTGELAIHIPYSKSKALIGTFKSILVVFVALTFCSALIVPFILSFFTSSHTIILLISLIIPLFFAITFCFKHIYSRNKNDNLGTNDVDENDDYVDCEVNEIEYKDILEKQYKRQKRSMIKMVNDNGENFRRKKREKHIIKKVIEK